MYAVCTYYSNSESYYSTVGSNIIVSVDEETAVPCVYLLSSAESSASLVFKDKRQEVQMKL